MKKMLLLTFALLVVASLVGCQRSSLFRGCKLFGQREAVDPCAEACVVTDPCDGAVSGGCSSCGTAGAVLAPGPEY